MDKGGIETTKTFHVSAAVKVLNPDGIYHRYVCPDCVDHEPGYPNKHLDCKNTFFDTVDGKEMNVGQCCCWSKEHGIGRSG